MTTSSLQFSSLFEQFCELSPCEHPRYRRWIFPEQAAGIDFSSKRYFTEIQVWLDSGVSVWAHIESGLGLYFHTDLTTEQKIEAISKIEEYENSLHALLGRPLNE